MTFSKRNLVFAFGSVFVLACLAQLWSDDRIGSAPTVGGFVFFDDRPLGNADVFFVPEETNQQSKSYIGKANGGGFYEVPSGVPAGDYRVVIRAALGNDDESAVPEDSAEIDSMQQLMMAEAKSNRAARGSHRRRRTDVALTTLPDIYSSAAYTILRVRVPDEGTETADLYLWSDLCEVIASEVPLNRAIR